MYCFLSSPCNSNVCIPIVAIINSIVLYLTSLVKYHLINSQTTDHIISDHFPWSHCYLIPVESTLPPFLDLHFGTNLTTNGGSQNTENVFKFLASFSCWFMTVHFSSFYFIQNMDIKPIFNFS